MDRWAFNAQAGYADKFSIRMVTSANSSASNYESTASPTSAGFNNSIKITSLSANTIPSGSTALFTGYQAIEGYNVADLSWGTSDAKPLTVSFWTKSSVIGSYSFAAVNGAQNRCYASTYTINQANTWEYKTVTIPGDTSGTWNKDNQVGMYLFWGFGAGSSFTVTTNNTWDGNSSKYHATGVTPLTATNGATLYITGVQAEKSSAATAFEYRQFGQELALCQRYFQKVDYLHDNGGLSASWYVYNIPFMVQMRAAPTLAAATAINSDTGNAYMRQSNSSLTGWVLYSASPTQAAVRGSANESVSQGLAGRGWFNSEL
jgi:hypothetical protein